MKTKYTKGEIFDLFFSEMPLGTKSRMRIAETLDALENIKKTYPTVTMQDIKNHNIEAIAFTAGFKEAVTRIKDFLEKEKNEVIIIDFLKLQK